VPVYEVAFVRFKSNNNNNNNNNKAKTTSNYYYYCCGRARGTQKGAPEALFGLVFTIDSTFAAVLPLQYLRSLDTNAHIFATKGTYEASKGSTDTSSLRGIHWRQERAF
jgi:hypothetical protein